MTTMRTIEEANKLRRAVKAAGMDESCDKKIAGYLVWAILTDASTGQRVLRRVTPDSDLAEVRREITAELSQRGKKTRRYNRARAEVDAT